MSAILRMRNAFHIDPIIGKFLGRADVGSLKKLRKMDSKWNHLSINELEKRASKLQLKPIDFYWEDQEFINGFLEDTHTNPQLFSSFRFTYPQCLDFLNFYFLTGYTPKLIELKIDVSIKFIDRDVKNLQSFFRWIAPELQELEVRLIEINTRVISIDEEAEGAPFSVSANDVKGLGFPKLTRFSMVDGGNWGEPVEIWDHFKFIIDKDGLADLTPNLTNLEFDCVVSLSECCLDPLMPTALSRWARLTHLSINTCVDFDVKLTSTLVSLSDGGMRLKLLDMTIVEPATTEWPGEICSNLSHFFAKQAQSLQILKLELNFDEMENSEEEELLNAKIQLPVFPLVHTLKIDITMCPGPDQPLARRIFEMSGPLPVHFPKLDNLEIYNYELLSIMYPEDVNISVPIIPLRFLKLSMWNEYESHWEGWKNDFGAKIRSIETFKCPGRILEDEKEKEIPWKDTLKILEISQVKGPLNIDYLKSLRELILIERVFPEEYLSYFDQVLNLSLSKITFKLCDEPSDEVQERFIRHFPFPVNFE